jgi:hydrogenase nickel incorporation protein HypA/HybF
VHEASLTRSLVNRILEVAAQQQAQRVVAITVRLGALSHMSPGHFREHFEIAAAGTLAEGARIDAIEDADPGAATAADVVLESVEVT